MKAGKKLRCRCGHALEEFDPYTVITGEINCQDCADEWMLDELRENFGKYRDGIMDMMNLPTLEAVYG